MATAVGLEGDYADIQALNARPRRKSEVSGIRVTPLPTFVPKSSFKLNLFTPADIENQPGPT